jgi:hypothetical protein
MRYRNAASIDVLESAATPARITLVLWSMSEPNLKETPARIPRILREELRSTVQACPQSQGGIPSICAFARSAERRVE